MRTRKVKNTVANLQDVVTFARNNPRLTLRQQADLYQRLTTVFTCKRHDCQHMLNQLQHDNWQAFTRSVEYQALQAVDQYGANTPTLHLDPGQIKTHPEVQLYYYYLWALNQALAERKA